MLKQRALCHLLCPPGQLGPVGIMAVVKMDRQGRQDAAAVGLHLASITPRGPIDGGPGGPAAGDGRLSIDFHLIDNLVNVFAKSQVGPQTEP